MLQHELPTTEAPAVQTVEPTPPRSGLRLEPEAERVLDAFFWQVQDALSDLPEFQREAVSAAVRARVELELELAAAVTPASVRLTLQSLGGPRRLVELTAPRQQAARSPATALTECRTCRQSVSKDAALCPHCGSPRPAVKNWNGHGYEYKSPITVRGLPLVHVAFGRDANGKLRVAKGVIAIGQFGMGVITIAQFGVGALFGLGQFVAAPLAIGQFALAPLAGIGMFCAGGFTLGMFSIALFKAVGMITFSLSRFFFG